MSTHYDKPANTSYITRVREYKTEDGEAMQDIEVFKKVYGSSHFRRVWLSDLLTALGLINNSRQLDVVFYIFENAAPSNNMYIGTVRSTAEAVGVSRKTSELTFKKLQSADIITKKQNGVYMIKTSLMIKGDDRKRNRLIIEYENAKQENKKKKQSKEPDFIKVDESNENGT